MEILKEEKKLYDILDRYEDLIKNIRHKKISDLSKDELSKLLYIIEDLFELSTSCVKQLVALQSVFDAEGFSSDVIKHLNDISKSLTGSNSFKDDDFIGDLNKKRKAKGYTKGS